MMKTAMERVGIVGAGMTGATVASLLRSECAESKLVVLDKGRGVGGRMSTSRSVKANSFRWTKEPRTYQSQNHTEKNIAGTLTPLRSEIEGNRSGDPSVSHHVAPQEPAPLSNTS